jgi:hypothetical protein
MKKARRPHGKRIYTKMISKINPVVKAASPSEVKRGENSVKNSRYKIIQEKHKNIHEVMHVFQLLG